MSNLFGPSYELTRGSDVAERDGMYLELADRSSGDVLAEVFYSDVDGTMTLSTYGNTLPLEVVEALIAEGRRLLPPTTTVME